MVDCVELWAPILPLWILDHLMEQLILPRLQREARYTSLRHSYFDVQKHNSLVDNYEYISKIYFCVLFDRWIPGTL